MSATIAEESPSGTSVADSRVHVVVMDHLFKDPRGLYRGVLDFLGVDDEGRESLLNHNPAKERRSMILRLGLIAAVRNCSVI